MIAPLYSARLRTLSSPAPRLRHRAREGLRVLRDRGHFARGRRGILRAPRRDRGDNEGARVRRSDIQHPDNKHFADHDVDKGAPRRICEKQTALGFSSEYVLDRTTELEH